MPSGRTQVIHESLEFTPGALTGPQASIGNTKIDSSRGQGARITKFKAAISWSGKTADEGPILVGYSTGLTSTEVKETLIANPQRSDDIPAIEESNRKVFPVWMIPKQGTDKTASNSNFNMRNVTGFPWREIPEGQTLNVWAFVLSDVIATGFQIQFQHVWVTEWMRD